ncbi:MAG: iron transporter [Treponema sp.]
MKKTLSLFVLASAISLAFVGCSKATNKSSMSSMDDAAVEETGFEEFDIGDEQEVGFLNVAGVYFQPVDMAGNGAVYNAADYAFHIEADISAGENDLGYGVGDFVPYLTVDYEIKSNATGKVAASGTFMNMNASDGPHYGANIEPIPNGSYTVTFKIHSPEEQGYLLHTDKTTGVSGTFANYWTKKTLDVVWSDWEWNGPAW